MDECLTTIAAASSVLIETDTGETPIQLAIRSKLLCGGDRCKEYAEDYSFLDKEKDVG